MRRINSSTVFMISVLAVIGALLIASFHFFNQMNDRYIMVQTGPEPHRHILNNFKYIQNKKALIFSVSVLIAGLSFVIMVTLPSEEVAEKRERKPVDIPKQPSVARKESPISAVIDKQAEEPRPPEAVSEQVAPPKTKEEITAPEQITFDEDIELDEFMEDTSSEITEGEDDVVYGDGEITNAAIVDFVQKYPDSALKFLYRKQLDGKSLTAPEEAIYKTWEDRRMSRAKVKAYILTMMEWERMPQEPLYDIWKKIRDHIFEALQ